MIKPDTKLFIITCKDGRVTMRVTTTKKYIHESKEGFHRNKLPTLSHFKKSVNLSEFQGEVFIEGDMGVGECED